MGLKLITIILVALFMYGCASTDSYLKILEAEGDIRVDIADDKSYDYKVFIRNTIDVGWDGGNKKDRLTAVNTMFKKTCIKTQVINEVPIPTGEYATGKDAITWVMKVKCIK